MSHRSTAYLIEISARITVRPLEASAPDFRGACEK
jgi:hypothetical protein